MFEICVKSIFFQYKEHFVKESKTFILPTDIYRHIIAEICEDPMSIEGHTINCKLKYVPTLNTYITKDDKKLEFKKIPTICSVLPVLSKLMAQQDYYLHVYWDYDKKVLTFEEEYENKCEN